MTGFCRGFNYGIAALGSFFSHFLLLAIRLFWGYAFFQAGLVKLLKMDTVIEFFVKIDVPWPVFSAWAVSIVECVGGIFLFFGIFSRLSSIPLAVIMGCALYFAHFEAVEGILDHPQRFINQLPFNYFLASVIVFCFGPGVFSIDYIFGRKCEFEVK